MKARNLKQSARLLSAACLLAVLFVCALVCCLNTRSTRATFQQSRQVTTSFSPTTNTKRELLWDTQIGRLQAAPAESTSEQVIRQCFEPQRAANANVRACFRIARGGRQPICLPVDMHGQKYLFAVDTGSELTIYDKSLRSHLGDPRRSTRSITSNGETRVELFNAPYASVGEFSLQNRWPVMCTDLSPIRRAINLPVYGLIGMSFLRDHIIKINSDHGTLAILWTLDEDAGAPINIIYDRLRPMVVAQLPEMSPTKFTVDLGCSGSGTIKSSIFDTLVKGNYVYELGQTGSVTISCIRQWRSGRIRNVSVARFSHQDLVVSESGMNQLGRAYWARYVVTFDFPNAMMYLKPGDQFAQCETRDVRAED